jgi:prolyl oligopeptidase
MQAKLFLRGGVLSLCLVLSACGEADDVVKNDIAESNVSANLPATRESETEDPFIWLENVEGERALNWAAQQNALSMPRLQGDPRFEDIRSEINQILTSDDRIPFGSIVDGMVYNF